MNYCPLCEGEVSYLFMELNVQINIITLCSMALPTA